MKEGKEGRESLGHTPMDFRFMSWEGRRKEFVSRHIARGDWSMLMILCYVV